MTIKEYPEWTLKYPAIDGKKNPDKKPIRSDIEEILKMNNVPFNKWYSERKQAVESLLNQYELIASIPSLIYSSEYQKFGLDSSTFIGNSIKVFKEGLDYLERIKELREVYNQ
jgi:hypothetical protein